MNVGLSQNKFIIKIEDGNYDHIHSDISSGWDDKIEKFTLIIRRHLLISAYN